MLKAYIDRTDTSVMPIATCNVAQTQEKCPDPPRDEISGPDESDLNILMCCQIWIHKCVTLAMNTSAR